MTMMIGFAYGAACAWCAFAFTMWMTYDVRTWRHGVTRVVVFGWGHPLRVNVTRQFWVHGLGYRVSWRVGCGPLRAFVWTWARPVPYTPPGMYRMMAPCGHVGQPIVHE